MIKAKFGDRIDGFVHRVFPFLFTRRLDPTLLTIAGAAVSVGAAAAIARGHLRTGGVLVLVGGFFDLVDGVVARHQGTSTTFGAFLDSTLDRLVDMALLLGIALHFAAAGRTDLVLLTGVVLIASVLVSYAKARAEQFVPVFEGGALERGERIGLLAAGAILGFLVPALWILALGGLYTVAQRFRMAYLQMEALDAAAELRRRLGGEPGAEEHP
ncbi:MAG TPA: CDP-alcohol phosphatidyltransferase family protein [Myxococcota bacterium]|jgi:CDP-diacylglycerol--glycerol-3-phosphate 3-phosphatidyltransferase|nr:CDP-alcohol phosphatidyltransferase family protein [Myxococcota bacterium]